MKLFITGTDTEVGKTVVTAALAAASGATALKPVASGVTDGVGEDAALISLATGVHTAPGFAFETPVAPHRAALIEGRPIDPNRLLAWIRHHARGTALVEGVGGWRVPLTPDFAVNDLAKALGWPVLVVAANRLGVLNHTALTVDAIATSGLRLAGVVLNEVRADDASVGSNLEDLRMMIDAPVLPFPFLERLDRPSLQAAGKALTIRLGL